VTDDGDTAMAEDAAVTRAATWARLVQRRKALGLTQEALAGVLGVERSTMVRWERGETEPMSLVRPRLARALQVSADRLGEPLEGGAGTGQGGAAALVPRQLPSGSPASPAEPPNSRR
jgi:transcriptional regulator with XRE-family HTH domain